MSYLGKVKGRLLKTSEVNLPKHNRANLTLNFTNTYTVNKQKYYNAKRSVTKERSRPDPFVFLRVWADQTKCVLLQKKSLEDSSQFLLCRFSW